MADHVQEMMLRLSDPSDSRFTECAEVLRLNFLIHLSSPTLARLVKHWFMDIKSHYPKLATVVETSFAAHTVMALMMTLGCIKGATGACTKQQGKTLRANIERGTRKGSNATTGSIRVVVNELRDLWDHSSSLDGASLTELERRYGELAAPFIAATSATDFFSAENLEAMPSECRDKLNVGAPLYSCVYHGGAQPLVRARGTAPAPAVSSALVLVSATPAPPDITAANLLFPNRLFPVPFPVPAPAAEVQPLPPVMRIDLTEDPNEQELDCGAPVLLLESKEKESAKLMKAGKRDSTGNGAKTKPSEEISPESLAVLKALLGKEKRGDYATKADLVEAADTLAEKVATKVAESAKATTDAVVSAVNARSSDTNNLIESELAATRQCVVAQHESTREVSSKGMNELNTRLKENGVRAQELLDELEETRELAEVREAEADAAAAATALAQDASLAAVLAAIETNSAAAAAAAADQKTATDAVLAVSNANLAASKANLAELLKMKERKAAVTKEKKAANLAIEEFKKEGKRLESERLDLLASNLTELGSDVKEVMESNRVKIESNRVKIEEIDEKVNAKEGDVEGFDLVLKACGDSIAKFAKATFNKPKTRAIPAATRASTTTRAAPPSTPSRATGPTAPTLSSDAKQATPQGLNLKATGVRKGPLRVTEKPIAEKPIAE